MSAASSARTQVREAAPSMAAPRAAQATPAARKVPTPAGFSFAGIDTEVHFKLNLSDIPALPQTMEVDGFKPSLLARLVSKVVGN